MTTSSGPIGVFDSGYGGLTVLREVVKRLPGYEYIYLGDNARNPYGPRSFDVVYEYTLQAVKHLFSLGCPLVVLACNTASAKALRTIQQKDLPGLDPSRRVLGVVRPAAEAIGRLTKNGHVGILATQGTVLSGSYLLEVSKLYPDIHVTQEACPMWVPLVENSEYEGGGADYFVKKHIDALMAQDGEIDLVVLGCTHYPLLLPLIGRFIPNGVKVLDQGPVIAESFADYLMRHPEMESRLARGGACIYFTTESPEVFDRQGEIFMGKSVHASRVVLKD
jgi:glutamate racemase